MLTEALKFINDATPPLLKRIQGVAITIVLLYLAAPREITLFAEYAQGWTATVRDYIVTILGLHASGNENLLAIITLVIIWAALQIFFLAHDTVLQAINAILPSSSLIVSPLGALTQELNGITGFTHRFYSNTMDRNDFDRLFALYTIKHTLSDDFNKLQEAQRSQTLLTFPRERILVPLAVYFLVASEHRYTLFFFILILVLIIQAIYAHSVKMLGSQTFPFLAANFASLDLIKDRLNEKISPVYSEKSEQADLTQGFIIGLVVGLCVLIYDRKTLSLTVGPWSTKLFPRRKNKIENM